MVHVNKEEKRTRDIMSNILLADGKKLACQRTTCLYFVSRVMVFNLRAVPNKATWTLAKDPRARHYGKIVNAPWYMRSNYFRRDLEVDCFKRKLKNSHEGVKAVSGSM